MKKAYQNTEIFFYRVTCNTIAAIIGRYHCKPISEKANILACNKADCENGSFLRFEIFEQ